MASPAPRHVIRVARILLGEVLQGWLLRISLAMTGVITLFLLGLAVGFGRHDARTGETTLDSFPPFVVQCAMWATGIVVLLSASFRIISKNRENGVMALLKMRGFENAYAPALVVAVGGVTSIASVGIVFLVGLVAAAFGAPVAPLLGATFATFLFAMCITPLSLASLGPRGRGRGYLFFWGVVFGPELLRPLTRPLLASDVASIPAAITAIGRTLFTRPLDALRPLALVATAFAFACAWLYAETKRKVA